MKDAKQETPKMAKPQVALNGRNYSFEELTVEHMEAVSELLEDARIKARDELFNKADGINKAKNIVVNMWDILAQLRREKKLAKFLAAVMTEMPRGEAFQPADMDAREADFKACPYDKAEEIFSYFFTTGMFWKLLIPSFSAHPRAEAENRES